MDAIFANFMILVEMLFIIYILIYSSYLFLSVIIGSWQLYKNSRMFMLNNELKHDYYFPISIIVPAYNEEVNIAENIRALLNLDYKLYEIVIVDDGSKDQTSAKLIEAFDLKLVNRPIHLILRCKSYNSVYETHIGNIRITLIVKPNGGKGDALNMGINASQFPYFLSVDADSFLLRDSLEKIVQPIIRDNHTVAVGGLIRISQGVTVENGEMTGYKLPWNPIIGMQIVEYDRSFLASRILLNQFNGNLIISGAFGLFKKSVVISCGGYNTGTLGEDMEMVLKLHNFSRNNNKNYSIEYEPNAVCLSQAPSTLKDLMTQRRRWYLGLFQCMSEYNYMFINKRFGLLSFVSYMHYLFFELLAPAVEILGIFTIIISLILGALNISFMIKLFLLYSAFGIFLTITAFFQRVYTHDLKVTSLDIIKAVVMSLLEGLIFRYIFSYVRVTSFIGYEKKKTQWGSIKRVQR